MNINNLLQQTDTRIPDSVNSPRTRPFRWPLTQIVYDLKETIRSTCTGSSTLYIPRSKPESGLFRQKLKTESCHEAQFVATGGKGYCRFDNRHFWRQIWHHGDSRCSADIQRLKTKSQCALIHWGGVTHICVNKLTQAIPFPRVNIFYDFHRCNAIHFYQQI